MPNKVGRPRKKSMSDEMFTRKTAWDYTAYFGNLPDPDRILEKAGLDPLTAFQDIETDDHLTAVRSKRLGKLLSLEWDVVQDKASPTATKEIKKMFEDLDIRRFCRDVTRCLAWGWSPIEIVWNTSSRYWYPENLIQKPPRWFEYNTENELMFMKDASLIGEKVPHHKLVNPTNEPDYDNPYGIKFLSRCYWLVTFKRNALKWWNVFLEKYAFPYLYAKVPPNTSDTEKTKIINTLEKLVQDSVGTIPNDSTLEPLDMKGSGGSNSADMFDKFIYTMDKGLSKIWLGGTLTTEMGEIGSYSAAQTHESGEDSLIQDDAHLVMNTANQIIDLIMGFNFSGPSPKFVMEKAFEVSKEMAETDKILYEQGVRFSPEYYAETYGKDIKQFEVVEQKELDPGNNQNDEDEDKDEKEASLSQSFKDTVSKYKDQEAVDELLASIDDKELQKQSEGLLNPIIQMVENSDSYQDVKKNLLKQWPKMDSENIEEMMLQAIFVSEAMGHLGAEDEK